MTYILLIVGFILLVKGADFFVDGSSSVAKLLHIPSIVIGLTVVAFGTSAPELAVSVTAALAGNNDIAVSNVVGSNIFNLLMVTGSAAIVAAIAMKKSLLEKEFPFMILITAALLIFSWDYKLGHIEGIILLVLFVFFVASTVRTALKNRVQDEEEIKTLSPFVSIICIIGGIIGIVAGGDLVVNCATDIALSFGLSQTFIGLTIVALGTSLPELMTSIIAARKGESDLAIGNVVGSNIFNILMVLGISAAIHPITVNPQSVIDMIILTILSLFAFILAKSKQQISKIEGFIFVIFYAIYVVYITFR